MHSHSKANPYSESFRVDVVQCLSSVPVLCHLLGQKGDTARLYTQAGINFQNAEKKIVGWLSDCSFYKPIGVTDPAESAPFSLDRQVWQIMCFCILHCNVADSEAIVWLKSLPDSETILALSLMRGIHDHGSTVGQYVTDLTGCH